MAGTPLYPAPEVARGAPASPQSDIDSLRVLLRYAATGAYSRDVVAAPQDGALKRLLYRRRQASARDPDDRIMSLETATGALATCHEAKGRAPGMVYAAISPDAKRLAYESGAGGPELWLLSPADTK